MKLYMAVTADELELPLSVCDTAGELAEKMGDSRKNIHNKISKQRSGTISGIKYVKVVVDDDV